MLLVTCKPFKGNMQDFSHPCALPPLPWRVWRTSVWALRPAVWGKTGLPAAAAAPLLPQDLLLPYLGRAWRQVAVDGDTFHWNKQILRADVSPKTKFWDTWIWTTNQSILAWQGRDAFLHLFFPVKLQQVFLQADQSSCFKINYFARVIFLFHMLKWVLNFKTMLHSRVKALCR